MIGMEFVSFIILLAISVVVSAVLHYGLKYYVNPGLWSFCSKVVVGWTGAWLGSPVLGHWFEDLNYEQAFREQYQREYGFQPTGRDILVEGIRLRAVGKPRPPRPIPVPQKTGTPAPETMTLSYFNGQWREAPVYLLNNLGSGQKFSAPPSLLMKPPPW